MEKLHMEEEHKHNFLKTNSAYREIAAKSADEVFSDFHSIDSFKDEIWLMQCPKGIDPTNLLEHKLKLPGRTNCNEVEALAVEFSNVKQQTFGYCTRKGRYAMRFLPIQGNIVLRQRLRANKVVTTDQIDALCPPMGQVPVPHIKVRHPLLGTEFEKRLKLSKKIANRFKRADGKSLELQVSFQENKNESYEKTEYATNVEGYRDVSKSSKSPGLQKKRKRKLCKNENSSNQDAKSKSLEQLKKSFMEDKDLQ